MKSRAISRPIRLLVATLAVWTTASVQVFGQADPLPSWNDGAAKKAIIAFVQATTTQSGPKFVWLLPSSLVNTFGLRIRASHPNLLRLAGTSSTESGTTDQSGAPPRRDRSPT